jgi:hypothetical protein
MNDPLAAYLHDHLAGSVHAIDLLRAIRDQQTGKPLGKFAATLLPEIEADQESLREIADRAGVGASAIKEIGAWVEEKISRLKLRNLNEEGIGTFEALELLQLGIHGKWALWEALSVLAETDERLSGVDFSYLSGRAEKQENLVDQWRLNVAEIVFKCRPRPD